MLFLSSNIFFCKGITMWKLPLGKTESIFDLELGFQLLFLKLITNYKHAQIYEIGTVNVIQKYIVRVWLCQKFDLWLHWYETSYMS